MNAFEQKAKQRTAERIRIAQQGGDVQGYLRNERNANLAAAARAETQGKDYQIAHKAVQTPELDAAVGNTPNFVAPSQQTRQLTNEEQALEIMGLLNPVDFSPEAVAERSPANEKNVVTYTGRMFAGGAANSLRGIANDISYSAQTSIPQQTAANAVAAYQAGEKFPEAEKAFQEYMDSIPQNQRAAMEITGTLPTFDQFLFEYVQKNTDTPELKKAVDWGEDYNKETAELYPEMQGSVVGDVAAGLGGMVPAIAASFVPIFGGFLGKAAMFSAARGNAMQQAIDNGASFEDAEAYGTAVGGIELATEALFSGLGKVGKKIVGKGAVGGAVEKYITSQLADNPTAAKAITRVINGLGEGAEEYLAEWGGWMADKATIQQDERSVKDVSGDAGYSFFVGTLISGLMQASDLMARGQSAQEALETVTETETPEVDAAELLTNGGQDPQRIPGTRSHANYILASPARKAQFEKDTGVKLTGTKAEQRRTILEYYRNQQNTTPQEQGNPLLDAMLGAETQTAPAVEQSETVDNALADALMGETEREPLLTEQGNNGNVDTVIGGVSDESFGSISGETDTGSRGVVAESVDLSGERRVDGGAASGLGGQSVTPQLRTEMNNKGIVDLGLNSQTDGAFFASSIEQAKAVDVKNGAFVSAKTQEELTEILQNGGKVFLNANGSAGLVVTADGDVEAVFKNQQTGPKGAISDLMITAIANGGTKLDCYGSGLVNKYSAFGFVPVAQVDFNVELAVSEGWDIEKNGTPSVYVMMHNGDSADVVLQSGGQYHAYSQTELDALPRFDKDSYFDALKYRDNLLAERSAAVQAPSASTETGKISQDGPAVNGQGPFHPINEQGAASAQATYGREPVQVPVTNFEGHLTSKTASTIINSGLTPNGVAQSLAELLNKGELSRIPFSDAAAVAQAQQTIAEKGFAKALEEFHADVVNGKRGKPLHALGIELFNQAVQNGDIMTAADIATDIIESAREQAQAIQVLNLFNKATPEGRVYFAVKGIDNLVSRMEKRYGDRARGISINEGLLSDYYEAVKSGNEQAVKETWQEVQKDIAAQVRPNWADRINAWRYLAMLGNPKTHIRNVAGNAFFAPVRMLKNATAAGLEAISGTANRTKAVLNPLNSQDRQLMQLAWQDYTAAMDGTDTGKYDESFTEIDRMRKVLPGGADSVAKFNSNVLAAEDRFFSQSAYMDALAGWFKANNITPNQAAAMMAGENAETFAKAREYAILEAKKATFQDANAFSDALAKSGQLRHSDNPAIRAIGGAVDAVLPFKRTPANIVARGIEYSPAYLMKGLYELTTGVRSGKVSSAEALDHLASGLTGTGIMALGAFLAKQGLLRGSGDDDEKQAAFDKLQGKQDYSLTIGDTSITLDWLAPAALPLFVGVELYELMSRDDGADKATVEDYINAALSIADPILETTMLSGINDLIDSVGYSDTGLWDIAKNIAFNYVSSFLPTIGGQIERTSDTKRQETYRYNESGVFNDSQYDVANLLNKVPGMDYGQIDYVDAWGRTTEYSDNLLVRALNQFANPAYVSEERTSEVETELQRLYDAGNGEVFPTRRSQSTTINIYDKNGNVEETRHLTAEEYEQYNRTKGQTSLNMVSQLMDSGLYAQMDDVTKAAAVSSMYEYANAVALLEVSPNAPVDGWITNAMNADNTARYLQVYSTYGYAADENHRDYEALNSVMDVYGSMSENDREAISDGNNLEKLYEASQSGVSAESWYKAYDAASDLKPLPGNTSVSTYQKLEAVLDNSSRKDADVLIPQYLGELQAQKYEIARAEGFSAAYFVDAYRVLNTVTSDKDSRGNTITGSKKRNFIAALVEIDPAWSPFAGEMYDLLNSAEKDLPGWTWSWR